MPSPKILRFIFLLLLLIAGLAGLSQEKSQPMMWFEGIQRTSFSPKFSTTFLFHRRVFLEKAHTYQHLYWASGNIKLHQRISLGGGIMYLDYHKKVGERYASVPEVRPFQYITVAGKIGQMKWTLRSMLEERFLSEVKANEVSRNEHFNTRLRFRLRALIPITKSVLLELSEEVLLNGRHLPKDRFDQNRAVARVKYRLGSWSFSGGYMDWLLRTASGTVHRPSLLVGVCHQIRRD